MGIFSGLMDSLGSKLEVKNIIMEGDRIIERNTDINPHALPKSFRLKADAAIEWYKKNDLVGSFNSESAAVVKLHVFWSIFSSMDNERGKKDMSNAVSAVIDRYEKAIDPPALSMARKEIGL